MENHPVAGVFWIGAVEYCKWLSQKTGKKYRLPTEAEWEYAAKGGFNSDENYSGGNSLSSVGWYGGNAKDTYAVGTRSSNRLGIHDMSGNVWEWCSDWYDDNLLINLPEPPTKGQTATRENPTESLSVKKKVKVIRGGAFDSTAEECRVDARRFAVVSWKKRTCGFRVVLEE